jgi:gamma-glutamyl hercynylcysteine S-oxide synthase
MITEGFTPQLSHSAERANALRLGIAARSFRGDEIAAQLIALRRALREFVVELSDEQLLPPRIATVNPPLWEAAHVAWFAEWFCVRNAYDTESGEGRADTPSMWIDSDPFLNSNVIAHDARWSLPQLARKSTLDYLDRSLDATLRALERAGEDDESLYRFRLAMFHEAMHLEAFAWAAQTLAWPAPSWVASIEPRLPNHYIYVDDRPIDIRYDLILLGFRFDNEIGLLPSLNWANEIEADLVSNEQFARFVESDEYEKATQRKHPIYWQRRANGEWQQRRFDQWIALEANEPVIHVSAHEADAYALWIGGRLPTEDELHAHFTATNNATWHGKVWEWTSTTFASYVEASEFEPGLYREYSQPWFDGNHRVLRGGSFATLPIMHHPHYRNFFTPERADVFAGFRVIANDT